MYRHTPGPWRVECDGLDSTRPHAIKDKDGEHVTYIDGSRYVSGREDPEAVANAQLIAAAPELLEAMEIASAALESCLAHYGNQMVPVDRNIRNAIVRGCKKLSERVRSEEYAA